VRRRVLIGLVAACSLLVGAASASALTLSQALARAGVPAAERQSYLQTNAQARTLATRRGGAVGAELRAVIRSSTAIAKRPSSSPALIGIAFRELRGNVAYLGSRGLPAVGTRVRIDGLVFERYAGQGLRIQPLGTYWAIYEPGAGIAAEGGVSKALDSALGIALPQGESLTLPYLFTWSGAAPPWYSAMAEGMAASAALRTWGITGDDDQLDAALRFGNATLDRAVPGAEGGLWFPLYAFRPSYRVLNGHLQALIAIGQLAEATGDPDLGGAFDRGVRTTVAVLPRYDTGGWGRYAPGQDSPVKYMTLMRDQLRELGEMTGDASLTAMGDRFARDLVTPPVVAGPERAPRPVRLRPGAKPGVSIAVRRDKPVRLTVRVLTLNGKATKAPVTSVSLSSGSSRVRIALPRRKGAYRLVATATDWTGRTTTGVRLAVVKVRR